MGFESNNQSPLFGIRYSSFLGLMYLNDDIAIDAIKAEKALIGEDDVKKGFTGRNGLSGQAANALRSKGVKFGRMIGKLTGVRLIERDIQGRKTPYLSLTVSDTDGKFNLSASIHGQRGVQMLIRKLVNAQIGVETEVSLFATFGQREGADRAYAEHGASLKQDDHEVVGIAPSSVLVGRVEQAMKQLDDAGIEKDDKETRSRRRASVETLYHVELVQQIQNSYEAFYKDREQTMDEQAPAAPVSNPNEVLDEETDDIPF